MAKSEAPLKILIADDEPDLRAGIRSLLTLSFGELRPCEIDEVADGEQALASVLKRDYDLVLLDVRMPRMDGLETLRRIKVGKPATSVALITAHANLPDAVKAIQEGAFDYIEKPLQPGKLEELVAKANNARQLIQQMALSRPGESSSDSGIIGQADAMKKIFKMVDRLAFVTTSVLIRGENGTGKELVARAIHFNSPRKNRPFVAVNCGAIPEALMESEFFGHEKGSFTGAHQRKIGKFQFASGGTLFLDEIGELPLSMQVKLLRVLQDQKFMPVGSVREVKVDVRIIAATNRDLEKAMQAGTFRLDLFYRLNVMPLFLPALRERRSDILDLAQHFIKKFNKKHDREIQGISIEAQEKLINYTWPGNIRELENAIEHAFVIEAGTEIQTSSLPASLLEAVLDAEEGWELPRSNLTMPGKRIALNYQADKERFEQEFIVQALRSNHGRINQTCERAQIPKNTLLRKIKKYSINPREYES